MSEVQTPTRDESQRDCLQNAGPPAAHGSLPVVGLGGSAGAISALLQFFKHAPADGGLAYVVVLHLSPEHESMLAEVLQRATTMPVLQVTDSQPLQPDTVFVIPPGHTLQSTEGQLHLLPLRRNTARHVTVDLFFRTLADTHGPHAAAVVLSGMDGDGASGIRRIKERGGLTIAQDPAEAECAGMPRSAMATGMVDWVLPAAEIATRVLHYFNVARQRRLPPEQGPEPAEPVRPEAAGDEAALRDVLVALRTRTGRDFSCYKRATILRRIGRRMQVNGVEDLISYLGCLRTLPGEAAALVQDLLISVTHFFRDLECFDGLQLHLPSLFDGKTASNTVRVWVAACATGEEAYSVAMLLDEYARHLPTPPRIQVFATDLDDEVLRVARDGLYPSTIEADVSEERLRRYFVREHRGYRVCRELRETVLFAAHDLLKDSPFSRVALVACRNLLIYLTREAQQRVFDILHFALQPGGLLFLGASEFVDDGNSKFSVRDKKLRLYERRTSPRTSVPVPVPLLGGPSTLALVLQAQQAPRAGPAAGQYLLHRRRDALDGRAASWGELHYKLLEQLAPPSLIIDAEHEVLHMSASAGRWMQLGGGEPTRSLLRLIHPRVRIELRSALYQVAQHGQVVRTPPIAVEGHPEPLVVEVRPLADPKLVLTLVLLLDHPAASTQGAEPAAVTALEPASPADPAAAHLDRELERLKLHLRDTVEQYEASTEELKASNEELQAMNEELRSATEELETSREELQSINEELTTVNHELKGKVDELGHANNDMNNLMDATAIATIFLDRQLHVTRYTPSAVALFNLIHSDIGRPLSDLANQLDYAELQQDAGQVLERLTPVEREVRNSTGSWFLVRALPYRTLDDRIAGVVFTFVDISERKRSQEALRLSDQRFAAIVNQASVGVVQATLAGTVLYANRFYAELLGYAVDELNGRELVALIHPDDRIAAQTLMQTRLAHGRSFQVTQRTLCKDGSVRWLHKSATPLTDASGHPDSVLVVSIDLTERRQAELALQRSETHLRLILENAVDYAILSIDLEHRVTQWNAGAEQLLGYSEAEMLGERFDRLFTEEDRAAGVPRAEVQLALNQGRAPDDRLLVRKDGTRFWASGALMAMYGEPGDQRAVGLVKILRDQTEERRARDELETGRASLVQAAQDRDRAFANLEADDQAKDRFLAMLAHELRNPLASIGAAADVMLSEGILEADRDRAAGTVRRQVNAMKVLLSDLLDVSLLRLEKLVFQMRRIDVQMLVQAALDATRHAIESAGHELSLELPDTPLSLHGDPVRLAQVLSNLLLNAIKYTPAGGRIALKAGLEGGMAVISVSDNGVGIRPEAVESMFELFTRGQTDPARGVAGLGVGLALARRIVTLHGGRIEGHSDGLGEGSRFVVWLPLASSSPKRESEREPESPAPARLRVLLADDNSDAVWGTATLLRAAGHQVDTAYGGVQGLELALANRPDVAVLDVGMPDLSGHAVARRIRAEPWGADVLLVAATGWAAPQDQTASKAAGFDAHLVKPIEIGELLRMMRLHAASRSG